MEFNALYGTLNSQVTLPCWKREDSLYWSPIPITSVSVSMDVAAIEFVRASTLDNKS